MSFFLGSVPNFVFLSYRRIPKWPKLQGPQNWSYHSWRTGLYNQKKKRTIQGCVSHLMLLMSVQRWGEGSGYLDIWREGVNRGNLKVEQEFENWEPCRLREKCRGWAGTKKHALSKTHTRCQRTGLWVMCAVCWWKGVRGRPDLGPTCWGTMIPDRSSGLSEFPFPL